MSTLSVRTIGKEINYIQPDILARGEQKTYKGILKRIHKRGLYGYCLYEILCKNGRKILKNELQVWHD